ncbi:hypothetical protein [Paraburkholderia sacchari]|uniref:hypothetical protein n=1 Tax=Paraburkholderia sacchari TaxID=159450 RepID=UPI0039A40D8F
MRGDKEQAALRQETDLHQSQGPAHDYRASMMAGYMGMGAGQTFDDTIGEFRLNGR